VPPVRKACWLRCPTNAARIPRVVLKAGVTDGREPILRTRSPEIPATAANSRFQLAGEIARGGMGAILKGLDTDLGRELAVKVLLDSHRNKPEVVERFIEEAQISGQLQHPGIVPVYELGQFGDQRPFFTMKLVKGKTLSTLLAERESPAEDRARYLGIFEQVCQTVAYAHSRGVIHRDLKPTNIMVGAFGEVQVTDWGLAKVLGEGGIVDERKALSVQQGTEIIETLRSPGNETPGIVGSRTLPGSVLGTPVYMSPEQASGDVDHIDERVDVFGLGAILCVILTGEPPYVADDASVVVEMATGGLLGVCYDRLNDCGADDGLLALARDCLAVASEDRLRDADAVSRRVTTYMESVDERFRRAEYDRVEATTRAIEERKRRRVSLALVASVLLTTIAVGGSILWARIIQAEVAKITSEAELEDYKKREQTSRRVSQAIATAEAFTGDPKADAPVDLALLNRASEAIARAGALTRSAEVDQELTEQVARVAAKLERRRRNAQLLVDLQDAWEWELERLAEQEESIRSLIDSTKSPMQIRMPDKQQEQAQPAQIAVYGIFKAAEMHERAFADWGLDPSNSDVSEALARIQALPATQRPQVLVSLNRWRRILSSPRPLDFWRSADWDVLQPVELKSRGGDKLEVLNDGSVLASGSHPERGYDLVFDANQTSIGALRLEVLRHPSLPGGGPGRGQRGVLAFAGLSIRIAPRSQPQQTTALHLRYAVADHSDPAHPLSTTSWNTTRGEGQDHVAVFEAAEPVHSESGFRVFISHRDKSDDPWREQNLGRFRWSVCQPSQDSQTTEWLAAVISMADKEPWRIAMRKEAESGDVTALIARASDTATVLQQPKIIQVELAELLKYADFKIDLADYVEEIRWDVLRPTRLEASRGSHLEVQSDGSIFASGKPPRNEIYRLTVPTTTRPVTAIRLELIPDERLKDGQSVRTGGRVFQIAELQVVATRPYAPSPSSVVSFKRAVATDSVSEPYSVQKAVDGTEDTEWRAPSATTQTCILFLSKPDDLSRGTEFMVTLSSGSHGMMNLGLLGRFRISVTYDPLEIPDTQRSAIDLLRKIHSQDPGDYWVNASLGHALVRQTPPRIADARRHATAMLALRPNNPQANLNLLRLHLMTYDGTDDAVDVEVQNCANRFRNVGGSETKLQDVADQIRLSGWKAMGRRRYQQAIQHFHLAVRVRPNDHTSLGQCAWVLVNIPDAQLRNPKRAVHFARRATEQVPEFHYWWYVLGLALYRDQQFEEASVALKRSIDLLGKTDGWQGFLMGMIAAKQGDPEAARKLHEDAVRRIGPQDSVDQNLQRLQAEAEEVLGIESDSAESGRTTNRKNENTPAQQAKTDR
jgi:serine/threonine protein kinase/tetratricopeptide (TPR) repeat protein